MSVAGSKLWLSGIQDILNESSSTNEKNALQWHRELLIQGKKISQLICYIWDDKPGAAELDEYFRGTSDKSLSDLLYAAKSDKDQTAYNLLSPIFGGENLPIFEKQEGIQRIVFEVSVEKFEGSLNDPRPNQNKVLVMTIPYPPRPEVIENYTQGYAPIKKEELTNWVNDRTYKPESLGEKIEYFPSNPYLPSSTS